MSDSPDKPQKTIYLLHQEMRRARADLDEVVKQRQRVREQAEALERWQRTAEKDEERARAALEDATTALLLAPGCLTDHLDELGAVTGSERLTLVERLQQAAEHMGKSPYAKDLVLGLVSSLLSQLAPPTAPAPAVEPSLPR